MRTIDKIKRMSSKPKLQTKGESTRSITIDDFQILKYMEEGQFGTVYLSRYFLIDADIKPPISYVHWRRFQKRSSREKHDT